MRKILLVGFLGLFLFSLVNSYGFSQSVEDVLKKMVEVQGGKKNLENIKDYTIKGSIQFVPMNANGPLTIYWKAPNKRRSDVEMMGMTFTQIYDGQKAWNITPQTGLQEMPEESAKSIKRQTLGDDVIANPEKYGVKFTLKGKEKVKDTDCFVLEQTYADGHKSTAYVDAKTYLVCKIAGKSLDQTGQEIELETYLSDFKKVGKRMLAHSIITFQAGAEFMKFTVEKVSYDTGLDDSLFTAPKQEIKN